MSDPLIRPPTAPVDLPAYVEPTSSRSRGLSEAEREAVASYSGRVRRIPMGRRGVKLDGRLP